MRIATGFFCERALPSAPLQVVLPSVLKYIGSNGLRYYPSVRLVFFKKQLIRLGALPQL